MFECMLCARNYNLRSGLEGHNQNYHNSKKIRRRVAAKKPTVNQRNIDTESSCLASMKPKSVPPEEPENLPSESTYVYSYDTVHKHVLYSLKNNTTYSFEYYKQISIEIYNVLMPTMQNDQCDPTTATTSTASSDQRENTSQSDHQFRRPDVPLPLRHYRHPAKDLKFDHSNALTTSTCVSGGVVNGTGNAGNEVVGDLDLGGGYVYADEDIWDCCKW